MKMISKKLKWLWSLTALTMLSCNAPADKKDTHLTKPNIVVIYADDLGFGDVSCYNSGKLQTPGIDRLAQEGIRFNNGYATSATCTPSRYALLTGEYPWRNKRAQILKGDAPALIDPTAPTLPKMLKQGGYTTGIIGKWHLGLGNGSINWNEKITPGPNEMGFDEAFIMAATNDRVPNVYVENGSVVGLNVNDPLEVSYVSNFKGEPTGKNNPEMLRMMYSVGHNMSINNGIPRIGFQKGGKAAQWIDEDMADTFLIRAQNFVKTHQAEPFFLFYALHQPHVPRIPHQRFAGKSGLGPRGDAILEADWCVSEFLKTLDELQLAENTIVIFSSDNGPVLDDGYQDQAVELNGDHTPNGHLRGGKYSLFDAGTHVPFIVRWNGYIAAGTSDALVSQVDLYASLAALTGQQNKRHDSQNLLKAFLGQTPKGRESIVLEGIGRKTAFRKGDWVLIPPYNGPAIEKGTNIELGNAKVSRLYNLKDDPSQLNNRAIEMPEKAAQLLAEMEAIINHKN